MLLEFKCRKYCNPQMDVIYKHDSISTNAMDLKCSQYFAQL